MDWTIDTGIDTGAAGDFIVIDFGNPDRSDDKFGDAYQNKIMSLTIM